MNENIRFLIKSFFFKILFLVTLVFFFIDFVNLINYNIYNAKVISINEITVNKSGYRSKVYMKIPIVEVEYYKNSDTLKFEDGRTTLFSNFEKNQKIKVIEKIDDTNQVKIFSFFYYWINFQEVVIILLISTIIYGYFKVFKQ